MDFYCETCNIFIKPKSKYKHIKSNTHKEFERCEHVELCIESPNINDIDRKFYSCIIEQNKKCDYYLIKCQSKLVFNDSQYCPYVTSKLSDNKTMIFRSNFLEKVIDDFKNKGYNFYHKAEVTILTEANKMDISYDFHNKHNMHAVERKLNAMINKNRILITKLNQNWRHPSK